MLQPEALPSPPTPPPPPPFLTPAPHFQAGEEMLSSDKSCLFSRLNQNCCWTDRQHCLCVSHWRELVTISTHNLSSLLPYSLQTHIYLPFILLCFLSPTFSPSSFHFLPSLPLLRLVHHLSHLLTPLRKEEKKSICYKAVLQSAATCLLWPSSRANFIIGQADGKVCFALHKTTIIHTGINAVS